MLCFLFFLPSLWCVGCTDVAPCLLHTSGIPGCILCWTRCLLRNFTACACSRVWCWWHDPCDYQQPGRFGKVCGVCLNCRDETQTYSNTKHKKPQKACVLFYSCSVDLTGFQGLLQTFHKRLQRIQGQTESNGLKTKRKDEHRWKHKIAKSSPDIDMARWASQQTLLMTDPLCIALILEKAGKRGPVGTTSCPLKF